MRMPSTTWPTISAAERLRVSPACPVAQNGQFMPQPAWDEMHMVTRFGYRMSTDSTRAPSKSRCTRLTVSPPSALSVRTVLSSSGMVSCTSCSRPSLGRSVISAGSEAKRSK